MFRKLRRIKQQLPQEQAVEILENASSGVLALLGDEGYPYALPMSFVYHQGNIYFHSAVTGHKVDAICSCNKASFCVVAQDLVLPEKYTTAYKSAVAFGKISIIQAEDERKFAAGLLAEKYNPGKAEDSRREIEMGLGHMLALRLEIEHLCAKQGKELLK